MADPSGDPDPKGGAEPKRDAVVSGGSAGSPAPTIADHDGGVAHRVTTRCRIGATVLLVTAAGCLLIGVVNDFTASTAVLLLLAAGVAAWAATLLRRAGLWSSVAEAPLPSSPGVQATVGAPKRLSPGIPGAPLKRRLGAKVVPIHADVDPQPGGGALVVHARSDGLELLADDRVRAWPAAQVVIGPAGTRDLVSGPGRTAGKGTSGRWVLHRTTDGAVFLATTRLSDTW